jgi:hypothetical protein
VDIFQNYPSMRDENLLVGSLLFLSHPNNIGRVFIGGPGMVVSTDTGVIFVLEGGVSSYSIWGEVENMCSSDAGQFRVDVELAGEGVFAEIVVY